MYIRTLTSADAEIYRGLRLQALRRHPEVYLSSYESEKKLSIVTTRIRLEPSENNFTLGAFDDGEKLVGTLLFPGRAGLKLIIKLIYIQYMWIRMSVSRGWGAV